MTTKKTAKRKRNGKQKPKQPPFKTLCLRVDWNTIRTIDAVIELSNAKISRSELIRSFIDQGVKTIGARGLEVARACSR